jgi:cobyrinic acid a,c-diamide synthase
MLARLLNAPVILILPAVKATRTVAAIAIGLKLFEKDLNIAGIIVNRVATSRQEFLIRQAIENEAGLPVLGVIPRMDNDLLPGRHLGLVPPDEHDNFDCSIMAAADLVERSVNMERLRAIAQDAAHNSIVPLSHDLKTGCEVDARGVKIGYFHNAAFTFYYPENFDAIDRAGAERIAIDPFTQQELPQVDALYIGGGFPETHAPRLADNKSFMSSVVASARAGLPIWAECGGLMFLARSLMWKGTSYPMAGLLPVDVILESRPAGHGYEEVTVDCQNPFIKVGTTIRGHEFHYSRIVTDCPLDTAFSVRRGTGLGNGRDGIIVNHTLASYLHVHSVATPAWMSWIVDAAKMRRDEQAWHF